MRLDSIILDLRKLGHYLLSLCPPLEREYDRVRASAPELLRTPYAFCARKCPGLVKRTRAARDVFRLFWWSDYSRDRVDWSRIPPDAAPVLRIALAAALLLCLLLPVAMAFPVPPLPAGSIEKAQGPVAVWAVWLWLAVISLAWGCILSGAARCNRPAILILSLLYLCYMGVAAAALPRAAANLLVPLGALLASFASERMLRAAGAAARGPINALLVGALSGMALVTLTPLKGVVPGRNPLYGLILGIPLGLLVSHLAGGGPLPLRSHAHTPTRAHGSPRIIPLHLAVWLIGGTTFAFLGSLAVRGSAAVPANAVIDFLTVWTGYLWPAYYFIGVGIILKVLKSTRVLSRAAQEIFPPRVFAAACTALFAGGAVLLWAPSVFDAGALPWPAPVVSAAAAVYRSAAPWLWNNPLRSITALQLRWVFLFDLAAVIWCLAARRLSARILASLLFQTLLAWFLVTEYQIQFHGFAHAGSRTAAQYLVFSIWLLWLLYSNGVKIGMESSAAWPASGRIAIFGAAMLFLLLAMNARATIRDELARNEVFLTLFLGVIDVGLPYALFVYADRRIGRIPMPLPILFGAFCLGAGLTLPLAALDKIVDAGGSLAVLRNGLDARFRVVLAGGSPAGELLRLPPWWIALRGAAALAGLTAFALALSRRATDRRARRAALILALAAAAVGLAAFSKSSAFTELPLVSPRWSLLFSPLVPSLYLDANVFAQYLAYALPALALALALTGPGAARPLRLLAGFVAAYALHLAAAFAWPWREAWLRSTGMLATAGLAGLGLALILFREARARVEEAAPPSGTGLAAVAAPDEMPVVGPRAARALACIASAALGSLALFQTVSGRLVPRGIPGLAFPLPLPAAWEAVRAPSAGFCAFRRRSAAPVRPLLFAASQAGREGDVSAVLGRAEADMAAHLRQFSVFKREAWDRFLPGARALDFSFVNALAGGKDAPFMGTAVCLPCRGGGSLLLTMSDSAESWQVRRWDLVRVAEAMRGE